MTRKRTPKELIFHLTGYSVDTMPLNKLTEYMADLATFFGAHEHVHLERIEDGSVNLAVRIDAEGVETVEQNVRSAKHNDAPPEVQNAQERINKRLASDNATARLLDGKKRNIIQFPGASAIPKIGPIKQRGTIDGKPYRVGGVSNIVTVYLDRHGVRYKCKARREDAQKIAQHLWKDPIRVEGEGTWYRWPNGEWEMESFMIHAFDVLEETDLRSTIERIRSVNLRVKTDENLIEEMSKIRNGS